MAIGGCASMILVVVIVIQQTACLVCHYCPRTSPGDDVDANIGCLALGWEFYCAPHQDRCYSTSYTSPVRVAKGCTNSTRCVGRTACCATDLCNADPINSLSGHGGACRDVSGCVQGPGVMTCEPESPGDRARVCLCKTDSYRRGATCRRKSVPGGRCEADYQCLDATSSCTRGRCLCPTATFVNGSSCDAQRRLGETCRVDVECYGRHSECNGQCLCKLGFLKSQSNTTTFPVCSGSTMHSENKSLQVVFTAVLLYSHWLS